MENVNKQHENLGVAKFDPAQIYSGASMLNLTETERKQLAAPFDDLDFEIRPDGFIYIPQSLTLDRLNTVIGIGQWALEMIQNGKEDQGNGNWKVFFDGYMKIRNCFVSRSVGESQYSLNNKNQSWASALEAAKSDCRQRCLKDLGVAADAWKPQFIRRWQKEHAVRVFVDKGGKKEVVWRRTDVDPFWNETGFVLNTPTVADQHIQNNAAAAAKSELPWLNAGPDYDAVLRELIDGHTTIATLKASKFRISKATEEALLKQMSTEWISRTDQCTNLIELTTKYNENQLLVDSNPWLKKIFTDRRMKFVNNKVKV